VAEQTRREIVIVDTDTPKYQKILADIAAQGDRALEVVLLDKQRDGISQISPLLANRQDIDAVHVDQSATR
jgi:hypothetical protein